MKIWSNLYRDIENTLKVLYKISDLVLINNVRNPFTGQMNNNNMSFDEDSCVIHKMASLGAFILNAERTMSLIYRAV